MQKAMNKVIKVLIFSDFFLNYALGLLSPVFAIFLLQKIASNDVVSTARIAGFAALVFWVPKAILQIPVGRFLDKKHGETDDFWFMFWGTIITGIIPFLYLISRLEWHIYAVQLFYAFGMALLVPAWSAIFTRHIDNGQEAYQWGMNSTVLSLATGIAGAMSGLAVSLFGFSAIFIFSGTFSIIAALLLLLVRKDMFLTGDHVAHTSRSIIDL